MKATSTVLGVVLCCVSQRVQSSFSELILRILGYKLWHLMPINPKEEEKRMLFGEFLCQVKHYLMLPVSQCVYLWHSFSGMKMSKRRNERK